MGRKLKTKIGDRFGRLVVIDIRHGSRRVQCVLICRCDCGKTAEVESNLIHRRVSCGCKHHPLKEPGALLPSAVKALFADYKRSARERQLPFELTVLEFQQFVTSACYYCGLPPANVKHSNHTRKRKLPGFVHNGIDRADSALGYTLGNCRPCCAACNYAKRQMSPEEYVDHCRRVAGWAIFAPRSVFD